jgi:dipeptidyl-peptidase-4
VRNHWGRTRSRLWNTLLTQKGYILFTLDQRGTGGRGKAFKNLAYGDIGKYMLKDHIEGVKYLRSLPYVDGDRIGIWGWSGGGYLTLMAMTKGANYFKTGVAVAPVSDFRLYDNIWTERYMGLPKENKAGYDSTSVLSYTDRYQGGLLIIHGTSDDNVHMHNTMKVIHEFQVNGQPFEMMLYPGCNHSMIGKQDVYYHLYKTMTRFILDHL